MGYILCTAEKPSAAGDIARVIGATTRKNGYYEGNGYRVTWAVGHLVGLAEPEAYGYMPLSDLWDKEHPENKEKALKELPLIPEAFKLIVLESTKDQFEIMKALMNDPACDSIIDCGDAGPEGHILQWFIRVKVGCQKPVKRFMATSLTDEAIKDAMNHLQDINKYKPVIMGEYCKKKADWIMGMSMSRGASIIYDARVDVGRVQSPTLFFVVKRYLDVQQFQSKDFYTLKADMGGYSVFWKRDNGFFPATAVDSEKRLLDKKLADQTVNEIMQTGLGKITLFETKNRATERPYLYDITELEREGNRLYGYTAEEVLKTAQSLYEVHKITSYPRTDSRFITHDLAPLMAERVKAIAKQPQYAEVCEKLLQDGLNLDKRVVDDSKVTDHHALLITEKYDGYDLSKLSEIERRILNLIIVRMLVVFSDKYKYRETVLNVTFPNGMVFSATGKLPVSLGWKKVQNALMGKQEEEQSEEEQIFPNVTLGQTVTAESVNVVAQKTTPPKLHTEATLLTAMENAGSSVEGGEILKGKGIGTQATRANIIKQLKDKGYIVDQEKGKTKYLVPTKQGISVIKVLPPDLYSPKITADWENQIAHIVAGEMTEKDFMDNFNRFIHEKLDIVVHHKVEGVDFSVDRTVIGKCPWCKQPIYEGKFKDKNDKTIHNVYCSNKECKFAIRKDDLTFKLRTKKNLTMAQIKTLLTGEVLETKCISKANTAYKGGFKIGKNDKGYAEIRFIMPK